VFSIDMKELLTKLGAKPDQIQRILATAEANRKKPPVASLAMGSGMPMIPGMGGGAPGGMPGGAPGAGPGVGGPGGAEGGEGGGQRGPRMMAFAGGGGAPGGGGMSEEDRTKMRQAIQAALKGRSMQDLSAEERTKLMQEVMAKVRPGGAGARGPRPDGAKPAEGGAQTARAGAGGEGRRRGGEGGGRGGDGMMAMLGMGGGGSGRFSAADIANAKLPPPPEQDSNLDVLLRPGLLADVEIIVEKIPNAIHIPAQAVFEREGKLVVFVKEGQKFVPRTIRIGKRSESTLVVLDGLKPEETIAMADPEAKGGTKQKDEKGGSGGPMNALPGGGPKS
jgi:hypothetical protein